MAKRNAFLTSLFFIVFDIVVISAVFFAAFVIRNTGVRWFGLLPVYWDAVIPVMQFAFLFTIGIFLVQRVYPGYGLSAIKELELIGRSVVLIFFMIALISYMYKPYQHFPRSVIALAWLIAFLVLPLSHFFLRNILSKSKWYGIRIVVFGEPPWRGEVVRLLLKNRRMGWKPDQECSLAEIENMDAPATRGPMAVLAYGADTPVEKYYRILNKNFRKVVLLQQEASFGVLNVESRDIGGKLALEYRYNLLEFGANGLKWLIDRFGALCLLMVLSPLYALISALIWIDSPGRILFRQERIGRNFKPFQVLKFRTMIPGAQAKLAALLESDPVARQEYEDFHKITDDPRVTRVGRWLRKFSLDELPQLWNVLRGDMSLVGPRAYMSSELDDMGTYAPIILRVRPGMTGWWQITERHTSLFSKRLQMDEFYISNWSLWFDIYILLKTVGVVLRGEGR